MEEEEAATAHSEEAPDWEDGVASCGTNVSNRHQWKQKKELLFCSEFPACVITNNLWIPYVKKKFK